MRERIRQAMKEKGQGEFHPALSSDSLMDERPSHLNDTILYQLKGVNNQKQKCGQPLSCLNRISFRCPGWDSNPHLPLSERGALSGLSYRGHLSLDDRTTTFDDISNIESYVKGKQKGQGEFHPAPMLSESLMDKLRFAEFAINISSEDSGVNDQIAGMRTAVLPSCSHSLQAPPAGFEPAPTDSAKRSSIQLSYRGGLIFDNEATIFDNISNTGRRVNTFNPPSLRQRGGRRS